MKREILIGMLVIGVIFLLQLPAFADEYDLVEWWNTLEKCEISKDGGITWFTVFEGRTSQFNMIDAAAPTGDKIIPAGTYNRYRVHGTYNRFVIDYTDGTHPIKRVWDKGEPYIEDFDEFTETGDMNCIVHADGTTNAYIDFDREESLAVTATWDAGLDGGGYALVGDIDFNPVVTIHE